MDTRKTIKYNHKFYLFSALLPGAVHKWTNITRVRERGISDQRGANSQNSAYQSQHSPLGSQLADFKIEFSMVSFGAWAEISAGTRDTMCDNIRRILNSLTIQGVSATHQLEYMKLETVLRSLNLEIRRQKFRDRDFLCNILITPFKSWGTPQPNNQFFIYIYGM